MVVLAPKIKLNNGVEIPAIGLGIYDIKGSVCEEAVKNAIDCGYRHIDTACLYENEESVGRAVKAKIDGVVKREDMFIVTKLAGIHHDPENVEHACRLSLKKLGFDYIDLYLMHFPVGNPYLNDEELNPVNKSGEVLVSDVDYVDTWKAMEKLVDLGLVRSIGLSNFNSEQTERVLKICKIKPVINQVECHPGLNQKKLNAFLKQRGIVITAYCPLARPDFDTQKPDHFFSDKTKKLAKKYNKTTGQITLRYLVEMGAIPIPKATNKEWLSENINIFDFKLNDEDMRVMDSFHTGERICPFPGTENHKYYPFNLEY